MGAVEAWAAFDSIAKENCDANERPPERVVFLADGDIHLCKGEDCPFAEMNEERCTVCSLSGRVVRGSALLDDSALRNAATNDADKLAGETVGGAFVRRRDTCALSKLAMRTAEIAATDEEAAVVSQRSFKRLLADRRSGEKKQKTSVSEQQIESIQAEATGLIDKIVHCGAPVAEGPPPLNFNQIMMRELGAYKKECSTEGATPSFSAIHDILLFAEAEALRLKSEVVLQPCDRPRMAICDVDRIAKLVSKLWESVLRSPYMKDEKKTGASSFKPFCSGVLLSLKRGVCLPNGQRIVPLSPRLAASLPELRDTVHNAAVKSLHASSHRGLCTLHRSIASCDVKTVSEHFEAAKLITDEIERDG